MMKDRSPSSLKWLRISASLAVLFLLFALTHRSRTEEDTARTTRQHAPLALREAGWLRQARHRSDDGKMSIPLVAGCDDGTLSLTIARLLESNQIEVEVESVSEAAVTVSWAFAALQKQDIAEQDIPVPGEPAERAAKRQRLSSKLSAANLPLFGPVVHVVRHPLNAISALKRCFCGGKTALDEETRPMDVANWEYAARHASLPSGQGQWAPPVHQRTADAPIDVHRAMVFWLEWNRLIEERFEGALATELPLRLEELDVKSLVMALDVNWHAHDTEEVDDDSRVRRGDEDSGDDDSGDNNGTLEWKDLYAVNAPLAREIFDKAQEYGFEEGRSLAGEYI